ncbi:hypothetical protein BK133_10720 [Paenibacillus sp. FSL H8-0548]|uniref:YphA family membrane protein n=1 Tax=Paenibacillus sp. FSL H8-0548 TaxID=1920422 RepID=UPI0009700C69|nr:hypothetical protein [Paenibacillus sp. FSL H8-0548]OMF35180.1 hypothetical protein BK133_10720 [Paenibacillus sp. FSL H8-0548]
MNAGYMSFWIMSILFILIATGWKPYIAPDLSSWFLKVLIGIGMLALLNIPLWWSPSTGHVQVMLHATIGLLLLVSIPAFKATKDFAYIGYLMLCTLMIAAIWGFTRKIYSYDPVFYLMDPSWDAPLLAGMFCGAFTAQFKQQCGLLIWGAVLGEAFNSALQAGGYLAHIGSLAWWDSFWIAIAAARIFSLLFKTIRLSISKLNHMLLHIRGGRSS